MLPKRNSGKKRFTSGDNRGVFHDSLRGSNEAWKEYLRQEGVCKERIVFDARDGLPVNHMTIRRNKPFMRYGFKTLRRLERALRSLSFIARPANSDQYISLKSLEIGYYFNETSEKWELFIWGKDMDRELVQECEQACERFRGSYISSYTPSIGEMQKMSLSGEVRERLMESTARDSEPVGTEEHEFSFKGMEAPVADIKRVLANLDFMAESTDSEPEEERIVVGEMLKDGEPVVRFGNYRIDEAGYSGSYGHDIQFSGNFRKWNFKDAIRFDSFKKQP